ncbi:hypothetical protein [Bosea sp. 124]|uniref:hypothetical protein n=1 Tax=Bosea sp. 124 TaxID=2135642 RepID=UPI000D39EF8F|nr:hypothetical protein [Bosea sp. 124]PTM41751.1 hypothetical protein C8D03_3324 [Bosea sp. 124]
MIVDWYRHGHEHRNDMLRFGFMRLHRAGEITYREHALPECRAAGFSAETAAHDHRHTSIFAIRSGSQVKRIVVDSEDSFFWMAPLVRDCDLYFCAGYSPSLFEERRFITPYAWQTEVEIAFYRDRADWLIASYGELFGRIKPYVPIAPNMGRRNPPGRLNSKLRNLRHKLAKRLKRDRDWHHDDVDFEVRYAELLSYRNAVQQSDIVLLDSLWGWPRHRVALHEQLRRLSARYAIHSRLNWSPPYACDAGDRSGLVKGDFPMVIGAVSDYETMLSQSRLGTFATGFHYGWRNIMTAALMIGLPVLTDRLIVQPWFDMKVFDFAETDSYGLGDIEAVLARYPTERLAQVKARNQAAFDRYLSPQAMAHYVLSAA